MDAYATREDLYRYGLPRGMLASPARPVASVTVATGVFEVDNHGFGTGTELSFRAEAGGVLPTPVQSGISYYATRLTDATFHISLAPNGQPLPLSGTGRSIVVWTPLGPTIDAELERYSRLFDSYLPAHVVPLKPPYPTVAIASVAKLAAASLMEICGQGSELIQQSAELTRKELARLARGVPLRDSRAMMPSNLAVGWGDAPRGWDGGSSGVLP